MDRVANPYNPGAGSRPPLLVGRDTEIDGITVAIRRLQRGRFERSIILKGLRGVGKTVLLNEFGRVAAEHDFLHEHLEATEDTRVAAAMASLARRSLLEMSATARVKDRASRALGVLRSFVNVHLTSGDLRIDVDACPGRADSGELDGDLSAVFVELGETAAEAGVGVLFTLDEIQYLTKAELSALIVGLHRVSQLSLPFIVAAAGLPSIPGLAGEARSYAERLFAYVDIGSLAENDARLALTEPAQDEGAAWSEKAVALVLERTQGYPYFLQEFGKHAWNIAPGMTIHEEDVEAAIDLATDGLDQGFFRARVDKTTNAERDYLRAMVALGGAGPYKSSDIANHLGKKTSQVGPTRDGLIKRGLCYAPRHGELMFTVPMFDEFVRRAM